MSGSLVHLHRQGIIRRSAVVTIYHITDNGEARALRLTNTTANGNVTLMADLSLAAGTAMDTTAAPETQFIVTGASLHHGITISSVLYPDHFIAVNPKNNILTLLHKAHSKDGVETHFDIKPVGGAGNGGHIVVTNDSSKMWKVTNKTDQICIYDKGNTYLELIPEKC